MIETATVRQQDGHRAVMLWVTWERQRRNRGLSEHLGADLEEIVERGSRARRYWRSATKTIQLVRSRRPEILIVQCPSIALATLAVTVARRWCGKVVVDAHNAGIYPLEGRYALLNRLCKIILSRADVVIVSNEELRDRLALRGVVVLADPVFLDSRGASDGRIVSTERVVGSGCLPKVVYVTSWALDEPYQAVISAAEELIGHCEIRITGRPPRGIGDRPGLPSNVTLLGYLEEPAYLEELRGADAILVLTTREACLTCGAYEALALGVPAILSDTSALRGYFGAAAVYSKNEPAQIVRTIKACLGNREALVKLMAREKVAINERWDAAMQNLRRQLLE